MLLLEFGSKHRIKEEGNGDVGKGGSGRLDIFGFASA